MGESMGSKKLVASVYTHTNLLQFENNNINFEIPIVDISVLNNGLLKYSDG